MEAFGYLSVLLSIILGLAITQILQGYRALLLARSDVGGGWLALGWSALVLLIATQAWWASFGLRAREEWLFGEFAIVLFQMALIYMMAAVVLPDAPVGTTIDLAAHFDRNRKAFFAFLLALVATSVVKDLVLDGRWPSPGNLSFHVASAAAAIVGILFSSRKVQTAVILGIATSFAVYVVLLFAQL